MRRKLEQKLQEYLKKNKIKNWRNKDKFISNIHQLCMDTRCRLEELPSEEVNRMDGKRESREPVSIS